MSATTRRHKAKASKSIGFAILVCSTSRYQDLKAGKRVADESGDQIAEALKKKGHTVASRAIVPDERRLIKRSLEEALKSKDVDAVVTCGGTGISPTDVTIETVEPLLEKRLEGFGEIFRWLSYREVGSAAVMTRAMAGVVNGKAVFCIPGSPQAVSLCLEKLILPEAAHIILHAREK
ncbi:MAG: molybdenum cofactor biosynthesis protein B [Candidatus Bathyarchaeia archaeon]